jgi:hypothetical protein
MQSDVRLWVPGGVFSSGIDRVAPCPAGSRCPGNGAPGNGAMYSKWVGRRWIVRQPWYCAIRSSSSLRLFSFTHKARLWLKSPFLGASNQWLDMQMITIII